MDKANIFSRAWKIVLNDWRANRIRNVLSYAIVVLGTADVGFINPGLQNCCCKPGALLLPSRRR